MLDVPEARAKVSVGAVVSATTAAEPPPPPVDAAAAVAIVVVVVEVVAVVFATVVVVTATFVTTCCGAVVGGVVTATFATELFVFLLFAVFVAVVFFVTFVAVVFFAVLLFVAFVAFEVVTLLLTVVPALDSTDELTKQRSSCAARAELPAGLVQAAPTEVLTVFDVVDLSFGDFPVELDPVLFEPVPVNPRLDLTGGSPKQRSS